VLKSHKFGRCCYVVTAVLAISCCVFPALGEESNPIAPRQPDVPPAQPGSKLTNPIDRFLQPVYAEQQIDPLIVVSDETFARRVHEDLVGLLPTPVALQAFMEDTRPDKRNRLVQKLLGDRRAYAEHWLTFWNDALRNAYRGTGFIDDGRRQITGWLFESLYDNKPYDRFVHELISPVDGSEGFIKGIVWRGVVNASQRRELQAAQTISQVFMGTNLKCASCHDNFLNAWTLDDAYGLANVFAEKPLETFEYNKPIGEFAPVKFLYPQLGEIDAAGPREVRVKQLADLMTRAENGRLTRTIVNRLWAILFGRGLVEPVDDMEATPWHADLLDWLAADLADHDYDLKHTLALICSSQAYQLPAVGVPSPEVADYQFRGPYVRRMSGEQFLDAVASLTEVWPQPDGQMLKRDGRGQGGQLAAVAEVLSKKETPRNEIKADWIWNDTQAAAGATGGTLYLRRSFEVKNSAQTARAVMTCDNGFALFLNGKKIAASENWESPVAVDLKPHLQLGKNVFAVEARNLADQEKTAEESSNPAGFILYAELTQSEEESVILGTDEKWLVTTDLKPGWETVDFKAEDWRPAARLGDVNSGPWNIRERLQAAMTTYTGPIRAALVMDDSLTRALGRSNREQVVTRRESVATTLQALELTNGDTLDAILKQGAQNWLERSGEDSPKMIAAIYTQALGRAPTESETKIARELIGSPATVEGVQDLLWTLVMLPEFQLID